MSRRLTSAEAQQLRSWFPNLNTSSVWVLGERNAAYNCLAWALGITNRWVWPWGSRNATDAEMTSFLRTHSYVPGTPAAAATYGASSSIGHIGRFWVSSPSSKLGQGLLITHGWLELNYGIYGNRYRYYAKSALTSFSDQGGVPEMIEPGDVGLPSIGKDLQQHLDELVNAVPAEARDRFEAAYQAWRTRIQEPEISLYSTSAAWVISAEFVEAVSAAREAQPLLVKYLLDPAHHQALAIAERVFESSVLVAFEADDPAVLEGEQFRARVIAEAWLTS